MKLKNFNIRIKANKKGASECGNRARRVSPVDSGLLFGHQGLQVCELEETLVEVVQVEYAHQQEGSRDEYPGEQHGQAKLLQPEVVQAVNMENKRESEVKWEVRGAEGMMGKTRAPCVETSASTCQLTSLCPCVLRWTRNASSSQTGRCR